MFTRRLLIQLAGLAASGYTNHSYSLKTAKLKIEPYLFDPRTAQNFKQKLFMPVASGPFGVLDVAGPLKIRATAASFPILPGLTSQPPSPFLLYQAEHAGKAF